jgi:hypothetical protein
MWRHVFSDGRPFRRTLEFFMVNERAHKTFYLLRAQLQNIVSSPLHVSGIVNNHVAFPWTRTEGPGS